MEPGVAGRVVPGEGRYTFNLSGPQGCLAKDRALRSRSPVRAISLDSESWTPKQR